MCPVRVHWHVKLNYKDYWRVKVSVTNFNYRMNYTLWSLVVQHPNLNNVTQVFSFDYKPLVPYESISKYFNKFYFLKFLSNLLSDDYLMMLFIYAQTTQVCSMAWNSTMTYWWKQGHLEMFNQRCFLGKTRTPSLSSRDGRFQGKSISMAMNACYHHLIHTHFYQILPTKASSPSPHSLQHCFSYLRLFGDCLPWSIKRWGCLAFENFGLERFYRDYRSTTIQIQNLNESEQLFVSKF